MLMPHPTFLRRLVDEYEALHAGDETAGGTAERNSRMRDLTYTPCVSTGIRDVTRALEAARLRLASVRVQPGGARGRRTRCRCRCRCRGVK